MSISKDSLSIKLDEAMKLCFSVSTNVLIGTINKCFNEHYNPNEPIEKRSSNNDYINIPFLARSASDMIFALKQHDVEKVYHLEFQTKHDATMALRMFQYGVHYAKEQATETQNYKDLYFPKQCVIYLEENKSIDNSEVLNIHFPDGGTYMYTVPTLKLWAYSLDQLFELEMYNLLPIHVFKLRKRLDAIVRRQKEKNQDEVGAYLAEVEAVYSELLILEKHYATKMQALVDDHVLNLDDCEKLGNSNLSLVAYLEEKYFKKEIVTEVRKMIQLYDRTVHEQALTTGMAQGMAQGIAEGMAQGMAKVILTALNNIIPTKEIGVYERLFMKLPEDKIVEISSHLREIESIQDLKKYLGDVH